MKLPTPEFTIHHNSDTGRFEAEIAGQHALVEYTLDGNRMLFTHTWVPPSLRGQGIAERMVAAALQVARESGREVVPLCSYVARHLDRHPKKG